MLVAIHQLHYLPWLRYFEKIARADAFILLDNVQYNKNGWQNRNKIKTQQGATLLTVPVRERFGQRLDEVEINAGGRWRKKHLRTLEQSYRKAPFFEMHAGFLSQTYARDWTRLNDLNRSMLAYFVEALGIGTKIYYASDLEAPGKATERLANLIRAVQGDQYYCGAFALEAYLDAGVLEAAGIELVLQHWEAPRYAQLHGGFVGDLAVVDLLMNRGPDALAVLREGARAPLE